MKKRVKEEDVFLDDPLANLSKDKLRKVIQMFSKSWLSVDGLWFTLVEDKFGLATALELDLKMWQRFAFTMAERIKRDLGIYGGGVKGVLRALRFAVFDPAMPFEYSLEGPDQAYMWVRVCRPQEGRIKAGRGEFPCKSVGLACYKTFAKAIDPSVEVEPIFCPPDEHPPDIWCKWKFTTLRREEGAKGV